jgi:cell division protease FtsH
MVFGDLSTGAQDGPQRTTDLVRHKIARSGVSEAVALATFDEPQETLCLQGPDGRQREYSEEPGRLIDEALRKMMEAPPPVRRPPWGRSVGCWRPWPSR